VSHHFSMAFGRDLSLCAPLHSLDVPDGHGGDMVMSFYFHVM
jgi:hypothetical protein